jgi:hypothetical protein
MIRTATTGRAFGQETESNGKLPLLQFRRGDSIYVANSPQFGFAEVEQL